MISLKDLDVKKACEVPFKFEVTDEEGEGTGLFLTVIGGHAQVIQDYQKKVLNERRVAEAMAEKKDPRGKGPPVVVKVEDDIEFSTELVAMRVVGWEGIEEPYSHENAVRLCTINPPIKEQILAKSDDLKNFPTPFTATSASTSAIAHG